MISNSNIYIYNPDSSTSECQVENLIAFSKYQVYKGKVDDKIYAIKVFPSMNKHYKSESSFSQLSHPNILVPSKVAAFFDHNINPKFLILSEFCKNGTFFDLLRDKEFFFDEKMTRTYFRQLVEAVEYLHKNGVSHLDIKLENILLDDKFRLRLADFDLAHTQENETFFCGTKFYRAPEQMKKSFDTKAADVFQMGIVLFAMFNGGKFFPYTENFMDLRKKLVMTPEAYWLKYQKALNWKFDIWSQDFKDLFKDMTCQDPSNRLTIEKIKESRWYREEVYTQGEIEIIMSALE